MFASIIPNSLSFFSKRPFSSESFLSSRSLSSCVIFKSLFSLASFSSACCTRLAMFTLMSSTSLFEFCNSFFKVVILSSFLLRLWWYLTALFWITAFNFSATFSLSLNPSSAELRIFLISVTQCSSCSFNCVWRSSTSFWAAFNTSSFSRKLLSSFKIVSLARTISELCICLACVSSINFVLHSSNSSSNSPFFCMMSLFASNTSAILSSLSFNAFVRKQISSFLNVKLVSKDSFTDRNSLVAVSSKRSSFCISFSFHIILSSKDLFASFTSSSFIAIASLQHCSRFSISSLWSLRVLSSFCCSSSTSCCFKVSALANDLSKASFSFLPVIYFSFRTSSSSERCSNSASSLCSCCFAFSNNLLKLATSFSRSSKLILSCLFSLCDSS